MGSRICVKGPKLNKKLRDKNQVGILFRKERNA